MAYKSTPLAHPPCSLGDRRPGKPSGVVSSCSSTIKPAGHGHSHWLAPLTLFTLREDSSGKGGGQGNSTKPVQFQVSVEPEARGEESRGLVREGTHPFWTREAGNKLWKTWTRQAATCFV